MAHAIHNTCSASSGLLGVNKVLLFVISCYEYSTGNHKWTWNIMYVIHYEGGGCNKQCTPHVQFAHHWMWDTWKHTHSCKGVLNCTHLLCGCYVSIVKMFLWLTLCLVISSHSKYSRNTQRNVYIYSFKQTF